MKALPLYKACAKYLDEPFGKYGCIELVVAFLKDIGRPLPEAVDGINVVNYRPLVDKDIRSAQLTMLKAFIKIGHRSSVSYPAIGDLLVVAQTRRRVMFPAVAVGNGLAIASFIRKGVQVFELNDYNLPVMARTVG